MPIHPSILLFDRQSREWILKYAPNLLLILMSDARIHWRDIYVFAALWAAAALSTYQIYLEPPMIIARPLVVDPNLKMRWRTVS